MKLTEAQIRCLASVAAGQVYLHFDVYGGYRWVVGGNATAWRSSEHDAPKPIAKLLEVGFISHGPQDRPFSGRRVTLFIPTEAGRAALRETE